MYRLRKARSGLNKSSPASLPSPAGRIASVGANDVTMLLMRDSEFVVVDTQGLAPRLLSEGRCVTFSSAAFPASF